MHARAIPAVVAAFLALAPGAAPAQESPAPAVVAEGRTIGLEIQAFLPDGTPVGGEEKSTVQYVQGGPEMPPALQRALLGMQVDESRQVSLQPEEAYGLVNDELIQEVDAEMIPADLREEGAVLMSTDQNGNQRLMRVVAVRDDKIVVDLNHPLAGKAIRFDVKVLSIE